MRVLRAQCYVQVLFRFRLVLRVETKTEKEVLKGERRVESAESRMN